MILDHIWTRFLGGDLYARATYMRVYTVSINLFSVHIHQSITESSRDSRSSKTHNTTQQNQPHFVHTHSLISFLSSVNFFPLKQSQYERHTYRLQCKADNIFVMSNVITIGDISSQAKKLIILGIIAKCANDTCIFKTAEHLFFENKCAKRLTHSENNAQLMAYCNIFNIKFNYIYD